MIALLLKKYQIIKGFDETACNKFIAVGLIFVICLRKVIAVGIDMVKYSCYYEDVSHLSWKDTIIYCDRESIGYYFLSWISSHLGISFEFFISSLSGIAIIIWCYYIGKYSDSIFISYLCVLGLGVYTIAFSGIRQALAMAMTCLLIDSFTEKKYLKAVLFFVIGLSMHYAIIVIIPYLLMSRIKVNKLIALCYLIMIGLFLTFRVQIGMLVTRLFWSKYLGFYNSTGLVGGMTLLCIFVQALFFLMYYDQIIQPGSKERDLFNALFLTALIQSASAYAYAFTRINLFYMLAFMSLGIPKICQKERLYMVFGRKQITYLLYLAINFFNISIMINNFLNQIQGENLSNYIFFWN